MTHDELEASVPLYAAGALERVERQALEAHLLSGCIPCRTTLKEYQSVVVTLPFRLPITSPPRTLKGKIMSSRLSSPVAELDAHQPSKPSLEPGAWMNHLFPPVITACLIIWLGVGNGHGGHSDHPGVFWMDLFHSCS